MGRPEAPESQRLAAHSSCLFQAHRPERGAGRAHSAGIRCRRRRGSPSALVLWLEFPGCAPCAARAAISRTAMTPLVQVVPHLPPTISGVGDYALWLAEELRGAHDIDTRFVVGNPKWSGPPEVNGFPVFKLESRAAKPFAQLLAQTASPVVPSSRGPVVPLLLHYVGYGYQKRGCPFWLARGLEAWRREQGMRRLVTMFHELYASGPIWASSFWTSPFQRGLAASVARISDRCWTNRRVSADELGGLAPAHLGRVEVRSEEPTSELQSHSFISYA